MKVLFIEDVQGTAYSGDIKEVKGGFARNYLLPKKLAVLATKDQMNRVSGLQTAASKRREATESDMTSLAKTLEGITVTIEGRAGRNDRLYGSITNMMIAEELSKLAGREIDRRRLVLDPIRQLGVYEVPVKLHQGIEPKVTVIITAPGRELPIGQDAAAEEKANVEQVAIADEDLLTQELGDEAPSDETSGKEATEEPSLETEALDSEASTDEEPSK